MLRLYHFTSAFHLPMIERAGVLTTTESNVDPIAVNAGPPVVWLTSEPHVAHGGWERGSMVDKLRVRISVEIDDAEPWLVFAKRHNVPEWWMLALAVAGGNTADTWYVCERPIPNTQFVSVERRIETQTGDETWVSITT